MPSIVDRIPFPSLRTYVSISVLLLSFVLMSTYNDVSDSFLRDTNNDTSCASLLTDASASGQRSSKKYSFQDLLKVNQISMSISSKLNTGSEGPAQLLPEKLNPPQESPPLAPDAETDSEYEDSYFMKFESSTFFGRYFNTLFDNTRNICVMINTGYCTLILLGRLIQFLVFGDLRVIERQHLKDKFWNFVFYKFIFVFGVLNVQSVEQVLLWAAWFSIVGFLNLMTQLSKDRFEYLSFSPTTPRYVHARLVSLLVFLSLAAICLLVGAGVCVIPHDWSVFTLMAADCVIQVVRILYVITRYVIHLYDLHFDGMWENRGFFVYYTELCFELTVLVLDFLHHLHMLLYGHIFLSMASLVICMQLRFLFHELQRRVQRHKNYRRVVAAMEMRFPLATAEELASNSDNCAICWDTMEQARKLPCGHLFHNSCLRSWLEQDTSCPTCREVLNEGAERGARPPPAQPAPEHADMQVGGGADPPPHAAAPPATFNHFFHFDGSRYVSWFPSFSVEVTHTRFDPLSGERAQSPAVSSQLDEMARQVQGVFPHLPLAALRSDLVNTRSVELTIENVLDGRVTVPQSLHNDGDTDEFSDSEQGEGAESGRTPGGEDAGAGTSRDLLELESASPHHYVDENLQSWPSQSGDAGASASGTGGRFSKSPDERESMLWLRKKEMLDQARKRYLALSCHQEEGDVTADE